MDILGGLPKSLYCKGFDMLKTVTDVAKLSPKERAVYEDAQRIAWDYNGVIGSALDRGRAEGRAEGEAKGVSKEKLRTAKEMKSERLSADMISRITGLSIDEINKL